MSAAIEQAVQHCRHKVFRLQLATDQQAVQHCGFETLSLESCQLALEFSWRHLGGRLPVWQDHQFLHA